MRSVLLLLGLGACFGPNLGDQPFRCGPMGECPPDYSCDGEFCTSGPPKVDAPIGPTADARPRADARPPGPDAPPRIDAPPGQADAPPACPPNTSSCQGDDLVTCDANGVPSRVTCALGCSPGPGGAVCLSLVPSNLGAGACKVTPVVAELHFSSNMTIDTTTCAGIIIDGTPPMCLFRARRIVVDAGVTVRFIGTRAAVLLATDRFTLDGTVDVGGHGVVAGAGATLGQQPKSNGDDAPDSFGNEGGGGGGGGHARAGAEGGADGGGNHPAAGGESYGMSTLIPLEPGGFGGRGWQNCDLTCVDPVPAGGGGSVQLVGCQAMTVGQNGFVNAGGGGGRGGAGGRVSTVLFGSGGGGGGAAGSILIEAPSFLLPSNAALAANGGGGGGGGAFNFSGTIDLGQAGKAGGDGTKTPGAGGLGGMDPTSASGQDGGQGGSDDAPKDGGGSDGFGGGAGGGGGSAGRIRINVRISLNPDLRGLVSPQASGGSVVVTR